MKSAHKCARVHASTAHWPCKSGVHHITVCQMQLTYLIFERHGGAVAATVQQKNRKKGKPALPSLSSTSGFTDLPVKCHSSRGATGGHHAVVVGLPGTAKGTIIVTVLKALQPHTVQSIRCEDSGATNTPCENKKVRDGGGPLCGSLSEHRTM